MPVTRTPRRLLVASVGRTLEEKTKNKEKRTKRKSLGQSHSESLEEVGISQAPAGPVHGNQFKNFRAAAGDREGWTKAINSIE